MRALTPAVLAIAIVSCGSFGLPGSADAGAALVRDLKEILTGSKVPTYKATYEIAAVVPASSPSTTPLPTVRMTWVSRPPDVRFDYAAAIGGRTLNVTTVVRAGTVSVCTDILGATCYQVSDDQAARLGVSLGASTPLDPLRRSFDSFELTSTSRERILQLDAYCLAFRTKGAPPIVAPSTGPSARPTEAPLEVCLTASGIPLRSTSTVSTGSGTSVRTRMTILTLSEIVIDADFALPYPVTSAPPLPTLTVPSRPSASPSRAPSPSPGPSAPRPSPTR